MTVTDRAAISDLTCFSCGEPIRHGAWRVCVLCKGTGYLASPRDDGGSADPVTSVPPRAP
jgi:hypothetical protein